MYIFIYKLLGENKLGCLKQNETHWDVLRLNLDYYIHHLSVVCVAVGMFAFLCSSLPHISPTTSTIFLLFLDSRFFFVSCACLVRRSRLALFFFVLLSRAASSCIVLGIRLIFLVAAQLFGLSCGGCDLMR